MGKVHLRFELCRLFMASLNGGCLSYRNWRSVIEKPRMTGGMFENRVFAILKYIGVKGNYLIYRRC